MQWQHRSPAYRCRPGRAASLRGNGPAGRVWRAVRRVAVPAPCRAGPQAPGAAAHPPEAGAVFLPAPLAAPGRALGGAGGVCAAAALCTAVRLVCGHLFPHHRTGCAGLRRPAGSGPAARCGCDRGKAHRRGVRPFAQRRVLLGQPEFCQRAAGGGSRRGQAQAGHCRRNAARHPGKMRRHCSAHEPYQRHHAGAAGPAGGSRAGPHWHSPRRAGRHPDLCARRRNGDCAV